MRIVCPSCAATYEIADGILVRPRTVRCSRCAREWVQEPDVSAVSVPTEPEPEPITAPLPVTPPVDLVAPVPANPIPVTEVAPVTAEPQHDKGGARLTLAWIASMLALAVLAFLAYRYRVEIQLAWPPSSRLFRLLPA